MRNLDNIAKSWGMSVVDKNKATRKNSDPAQNQYKAMWAEVVNVIAKTLDTFDQDQVRDAIKRIATTSPRRCPPLCQSRRSSSSSTSTSTPSGTTCRTRAGRRSRRTTTRTTERSLRASADRRHGWKPAAYLCGIRWSARLSPGQTSQAYVVSAFRRTRHGPAKAGHYGQQETAEVQRRVGRPACASRSGGWDDVAARNGRERCCSTMEQARCHRRSRVSG